jgi:DNA-binding MarR family transcriptional regulator
MSIVADVKTLFKKLDDREFEILSIFRDEGACTRYDIYRRSKIPQETVYRKVKKLLKKGFLEVIKEEKHITAKTKRILTLSMPKGLIASLAFKKVWDNVPQEHALRLEAWVKWQNEYNIDFSDANLNWHYFLMTMLIVMTDFPDYFPSDSQAQEMKKLVEGAERATDKIFKDGLLESYEKKHVSKD